MNSQSESVCLIEKPNKRLRRKSRYDLESDLPTPPPPPPSPLSPQLLSSENVQSKNKNNKEISQSVEDAFLCLSKLYSLVEEIIEIRDRNSKLFKRVRELERIKVSRKSCNELEKNLSNGQDIYLPDEDVGFAESLLGAMLSSSYDDDDRYQPRRNSSLNRVSSSSTTTTLAATTPRKRENNNPTSLTIDQRRVSCPIVAGQDTQFINNRRNSMKIMKNNSSSIKRPSLVFGQPKVSKWTRVKAAFKWEKAACNNSDVFINSCNSTIIDSNSLKYLKIPDGNSTGVILSETSAPATPVGTISSSSSIDDVFHRTHRPQSRRIARRDNDIEEKSDSDPSRRSRSLDGETSTPLTTFIHDQPCSKDVLNSGKIEYRIHKTPWGKMKDIMQLRRDSLGRQINSRNSRHEDNHSTSSLDSTDIHRTDLDGRQPRVRVTSEPSQSSSLPVKKCLVKNFEMTDLATRRLTPMLTITVPSSEELRTLSSPESITPPLPPLAQRQLSDSACKIERIHNNCSPGSPVSASSSGITNNRSRSRVSQDDFRRQQSSKGDSLGSSPKTQRRNSKWNKVKRAFLTGPTSVPTSPSRISSYFFDDGDGTACSYSASASAEDLDNDASSINNPAAQAEIQRNYRLLHDKLGAEFYRKLAEWEKLKAIKDLRSANRDRESRLLCEERLTPEFKKKLEEWKRMSKGSMTNEPRSVNKRRITDWQLWRSSSSKTDNKIDSSTVQNSTGLSEDFIKKMEEWKKIKSSSVRRNEDFDVKTLVGDDEREKIKEEEEDEEIQDDNCEEEESCYSSANKNKYINKLEGWKGLVDEEFKSLDKIIGAMENERQTRLSKLHRVVGSAPEKTQEILVHTSTGYYRFEGISKTFTRKLYEWEKSQGITPELSTFRLLDPLRYGISSDPQKPSANLTCKQVTRSTLIRSKSVGCLLKESWRTRTEKPPNYSGRRPWSLSLNDLYRLEMRNCVGSEPAFLNEEDTLDDAGLEDLELEPEAMIVDIEDVIEETASPLTKLQPHQTPVYSVAGSETTSIAIPLGTVTSMHEPSAGILIEPEEVRPIAVNHHDDDDESTEDSLRLAVAQPCPTLYSDESLNEDHHNFERLKSVEDKGPIDDDPSTPDKIIFDNLREEPEKTGVENTRTEVEKNYISTRESNNFVPEEEDMAEAVITVAGRQHSRSKNHLKTRRLTDTQVGYEWYQNSLFTSKQDDDEPQQEDQEIGKYIQVPNYERIIINKDTLNKIVVPTSSGTLDTSTINTPPTTSKSKNSNNEIQTSSGKKLTKEPKSVFVKTKRIVFSPFKRDSKLKNNNSQELKVVDNNNDDNNVPVTTSDDKQEFQNCLQRSKRMTMDIPKSPILSRKEYKNIPSYLPKETSPSIRMMIKKYNEKIEGSNNGLPGSGTSSGSASPIWRSPVTQRRIATRMEKYQEEVRKAIAGPSYHFGMQKNYERQQQQPGEISKSATIDFTRDSKKKSDLDCEESAHCVLRSETMPAIGGNNLSIKSDYDSKSNFIPSVTSSSTLPSSRTLKIQKAKQDFFEKEENKYRENYREDNDENIKNLSRADLIKSASVGMINIESDAFERLQLSPAVSTSSNRGSDSLPRSSEQLEHNLDKSGKESRFHQLTSKFKKARLKKSRVKESASMSTVSMLCRQSLLVDIASEGSKSCPTTPSPSTAEHYEYSRNTK